MIPLFSCLAAHVRRKDHLLEIRVFCACGKSRRVRKRRYLSLFDRNRVLTSEWVL